MAANNDSVQAALETGDDLRRNWADPKLKTPSAGKR